MRAVRSRFRRPISPGLSHFSYDRPKSARDYRQKTLRIAENIQYCQFACCDVLAAPSSLDGIRTLLTVRKPTQVMRPPDWLQLVAAVTVVDF